MEDLFKTDFHYRIAKEAGLAKNDETGEPAETFMMMSLNTKLPIPEEEIPEIHEKMRENTAKTWNYEDSWIECITKEEYDRESGDDEEDGLSE